MGSRTRARIAVELGTLKPIWTAWCAQHGVTPGEGLRRLAAETMEIAVDQPNMERLMETPSERDVRIGVGLTRAEMECVKAQAYLNGFTPNRWIAALVRAHLTKQPQFGNRELMLFAESNRQLAAIRTRLNALERRADANERMEGLDWQQLRGEIDAHLRSVVRHLQSNLDRWGR
ncbi:hypothetical protein WT97_07805 [Burkholderia sp. MSMB1459WGS]|uniref:hypothetical protein n=1 Tax=Burkholderia sp. MSMB1459WGS TaxID=1637970 RepID=UPI00075FA249|nr:hypothetical protein [Burkholderia sp. MSMB1459WGS]KWO47957.1 hypothetical protein WT97_07805 [Burkholderia sp. MSMB1459WGS]